MDTDRQNQPWNPPSLPLMSTASALPTVRNQQVEGSSPFAGSTNPKQFHEFVFAERRLDSLTPNLTRHVDFDWPEIPPIALSFLPIRA